MVISPRCSYLLIEYSELKSNQVHDLSAKNLIDRKTRIIIKGPNRNLSLIASPITSSITPTHIAFERNKLSDIIAVSNGSRIHLSGC
jgi:hypothetical protein